MHCGAVSHTRLEDIEGYTEIYSSTLVLYHYCARRPELECLGINNTYGESLRRTREVLQEILKI